MAPARRVHGPSDPSWIGWGPGSGAHEGPVDRDLDRDPQPRRRLGAAPHAELLEYVVDVVLDRRELDAELAGDLLVRPSVGDQLDDLALPRRQALRRRSGSGRAPLRA